MENHWDVDHNNDAGYGSHAPLNTGDSTNGDNENHAPPDPDAETPPSGTYRLVHPTLNGMSYLTISNC